MSRSQAELDDLISATRLRLRRLSPFFSALAMFAEVSFTVEVPIAATDGSRLLFHPEGYGNLPPAERDAVFLHELLHAALLHPTWRRLWSKPKEIWRRRTLKLRGCGGL